MFLFWNLSTEFDVELFFQFGKFQIFQIYKKMF